MIIFKFHKVFYNTAEKLVIIIWVQGTKILLQQELVLPLT
jgi:hypothetical protein